MLSGKTLLITGGTGSFGNAVVARFLDSDCREVRIFSRDEKKQEDMRAQYRSPKLKFIIGDVRDLTALQAALRNVDLVFHAAALKQVPACEFYPLEAVRTNVLGASNLIQACVANGVERAILLSTDKAVYPINAMGMSKALMEKLVTSEARSLTRREGDTILTLTRYGNVMASRGSVIPLFVSQIKAGQPITVTDPNMTRFLMSLEDSVDLVLHAFAHGCQGDLFVQKAPASTVGDLAAALLEIFGARVPVKIIGTRHGEKVFESLVSREEMAKAEDLGRYYRVPADTRDLNYHQYLEEGDLTTTAAREYTSDNAERLDKNGLIELLLGLPYIQEQLRS